MKTFPKGTLLVLLVLGCSIITRGQKNNNLTLQFNNVVGDRPLTLNDQTYANAAGERFTITTVNYFVSNLKFRRKDGTEYIVPQDSSYFLIKQTDSTTKSIHLTVPKGKFTAVTLIIGVDSARSTTDLSQRKDALDISGGMMDGMYWTWNSGYLFFKLEGICEQAKPDMTGQKKFRYHIGGFGGYDKPSLNNIKEVTIDLSQHGIVNTKRKRHVTVNVNADILKAFNGKHKMSIAEDSNIMFGARSKAVAENYSDMFSHVSTVNR